MSYSTNIFKILFNPQDHLFRLKEAETTSHIAKNVFLLLSLSIIIYGWMSWLGVGTDPISRHATDLAQVEYELSKLWFLIGRALYALLFALFILFFPSLLFRLAYKVPYKKTVIIQLSVLLILLLERLTWIPLLVSSGLEWFVSPFSFGIITSYITDISWVIFFFGALSIFQIWVIWLQVRTLAYLSLVKKRWIWTGVLLLHLAYWASAAALAFYDINIIHVINVITQSW